MACVSVVIPVYNSEKYLRQCLDSICRQSFSDIEIICVDDGSTDSSIQILNEYEKADHRIRVIKQQNQYAGVARNVGMQNANGEYLLFLDSDDFFDYRMIEKMYSTAVHDNLDIVLCQYDQFNDENRKISSLNFDKENSYFTDKIIFSGADLKDNAIFQISIGVAWNKLFKKEFVEKSNIRFQELRCSNDGFFVYCLMAKAKRIKYIKEPLLTYRYNNSSSLSGTREKSWENAFQMLLAIKEELIKSNLYEIYERSFLNYALTHSIGYLNSIVSKEQFQNCYIYVQNIENTEFHLLNKGKEFFYNEKVFDEYRMICDLKYENYKRYSDKSVMFSNSNIDERFLINALENGHDIIVFGAGKIGNEILELLEKSKKFNSIIQVDNNYEKLSNNKKTVLSPTSISERKIDYIIVAIKNDITRYYIACWLQSIGIQDEKIIV